jgi:hypothetical protein
VDQIVGQHDAHLIAPGLPGAGNLLVFDNQGEAGYPRERGRAAAFACAGNRSRQQTDRVGIHGRDSDLPDWGFYSSFISSARRLPNGNTLIDEGMNGRIFQVTPRGEIAWEYISPYFAQTPVAGAGKPCAATGCTAPSLCLTTGCPMARHVPSRR